MKQFEKDLRKLLRLRLLYSIMTQYCHPQEIPAITQTMVNEETYFRTIYGFTP
jgi:hypothetical protein